MHFIIGLAILGFLIMAALFVAQAVLTVVAAVVMLPFTGIAALVRKIRN